MTKDIKGYEGLYFCNIEGEFFSYPKKTRKGTRKLKTIKHGVMGYLSVDLCKNGNVKKTLAHRLIAETFLPNLENKPQVNHINGIKSDNRVSNLEWVTSSENQLHWILIGLRSSKGVKNSQSKLNENDVLSILKDNRKYIDICADYDISLSTIYDIKKRRSWSHINL